MRRRRNEFAIEVPSDHWPEDKAFLQMKAFVFRKWCDRADENHQERPTDLSSACKFASLFSFAVLGGVVAGNHSHQFNIVNGTVFDLCAGATDISSKNVYFHDQLFWGNDEHVQSVKSCVPRVAAWLKEFAGAPSAARLESEWISIFKVPQAPMLPGPSSAGTRFSLDIQRRI